MVQLRQLREEDFPFIINVLDDWWGGRSMTSLLQRLFFTHFHSTSWVLVQDEKIIDFLVGFLSQSHPGEAYIHFVGLHPAYRKQGFGRMLYRHFFRQAHQQGCRTVRCITSPINRGSIAFHTRMGFQMVPSPHQTDDIPIHKDYDGPGKDRVLFVKQIQEEELSD